MSQERDIFLSALERPSGGERRAFLDRFCGVGTSLRQAVDTLLANHCEDAFLDQPVLHLLRDGSPTPNPAPSHPPGTLEKPGDRIGRYKLLEIIGEGGGGTVFMADQEEPVRRRVALKIVKPGMDTKSVIARFETERQALAMMDHPNIAKVLDAGSTEAGRPFFVMELVRGIRITDYCDENLLTTRERLLLFIKVCQAIQHAHQKGIIHRDVKPSNILVTLHDGIPVPKVIDFGIAKAIDQRLTDHTFFTEFRAFLGTPAYMSPEQAEMSGLDVDTRADIYSLGVVLYEMLTGRTPFDSKALVASGLDAMRRTIREQEPVRPSTRIRFLDNSDRTLTAQRHQAEPAQMVSVLTGDLDWIVLKALEKDRARRFETATGLALDIQRYLDDEPIFARPPSAFYRFQKLVRRHRVAFFTAGAVGVALLVGLTLATWQFIEKSRAYQRISESEAYQRRLGDRARRAQETEAYLRRQAQAQELLARQKAYAADINLAQHALAANNLGRARELLENYRPKTSGPDLRHWEWAYLWHNCGTDALFTLCQSSNSVGTLSASHDGRWVSVSTGDTITVWDMRSRQTHARIETGSYRSDAVFSPTAPLLAYSESTGAPFTQRKHQVRLWNVSERRVEADFPLTGSCRALAFSADGSELLTVSNDGHIESWNVSQAVRLSRVTFSLGPRLPAPYGTSIRISPDLRRLAIAADAGNLQLVDAGTGELRWTAQAAEEHLVALAFSPDSRLLATGAGFVESSIRIWDVATSREITRLEGHRTWVSSLIFWPDGQTLASSSADQTIRLWDVSDIRPMLGTPSRLPRPRLRRSETDQTRHHATLRGHQLEVWSLALLPDNTTLVSGCKDGSVCVWDTTRRPRDRSRITLSSPVRTWRFAPDSLSIVAVDAEGRVSRWDGEDFQYAHALAELGPSQQPHLLSPDARFALATTPGGHFRIWDLILGVGLPEWRPDASKPIIPIGFDASSKFLRTRNIFDGTLQEWEIETGREIRSWQGSTSGMPWLPTAFADDGSLWLQISPSGKGLLGTPDAASPIPIELGLPQVDQVVFSPDGLSFAAVSRLGQGALWQTMPPQKVASISGFLQGTHSVAFSPDGQRLAVGSDGREAIKLWDVDSHQELITLIGEGSGFRTIGFSPDGNLLGASNSKGILHVWRADVDSLDLSLPSPEP